MTRRYALLALALSFLVAGQQSFASDLVMVRSEHPFPETMNNVQRAIAAHGYQITRIQRVDVGLASSGFKTAEYRLVFFAKADEMHKLPALRPELMAYLPLKMVVFAEGDTTLVLIDDPALFKQFFPDSALQPYFTRWEKDVRAILDEIRQAE